LTLHRVLKELGIQDVSTCRILEVIGVQNVIKDS